MKTAREVIDYCYSHGRIIDYDRRKIALEDILEKDGVIQQQAEQIEALSDEVNRLRNNKKGRKPSCLINLDLRKENQRLKQAILKYGNGNDFDWAVLEEIERLRAILEQARNHIRYRTGSFEVVLKNIEQALAAQPQKGGE